MSLGVRFLPLVLLLVLIAGLAWRLAAPADHDIPSKIVGKPLPDTTIGPADFNGEPIRLRSLTGQPMIINFFASWCVPCVAEAAQLGALQQRGIKIVGIAVRDKPDDLRAFLKEHGNPYSAVGTDPQSAVQIDLGSSGVPESFVVDGRGIIRYQHIGPIEPGDVQRILGKLAESQA
jgi:cytochrome c biogenesis protein CcmG/thiol:disulfide interchange protein DsbE